MPERRLLDIQTEFQLLNLKFAKLREAIWNKIKENGLETRTFATNSIRLTLQGLVERIIDRFESKLFAQNDASNRETILNLIHVEKANLVCHVGTKKKPIANKTRHFYLAIPDRLPISIGWVYHQHKRSQTTPKDCNIERHSWAPIQNFLDTVSLLLNVEEVRHKAIDAISFLAPPSDTKLTKLASYS